MVSGTTPTRLAGALLAAVLGASGCAAAKASIHLVAADNAVHRAEGRDAPDAAPYEYTLAQRYLEKAREEFGEADYRVAEALSKASARWADRAIIVMEQKGPTVDPSNLTDDTPAAPAAPEPAPEPTPAPPTETDPLFEPSTDGPVVPPAEPAPEPEPAEEEKGEFDDIENIDLDEEDDEDDIWGPK